MDVTPPLLLLAPGAGAPASHPWMLHWTRLLQTIGEVRTFDYPYMIEGKRRPDRLPDLIAAHRDALTQISTSSSGPVVLIGKSMGGRIGCHLSLEQNVAALVCLGYPLCAGGDPARLRDQVLREINAPVLFAQGTRDPLCPLNLLEQVRSRMQAPNELYVVEGGDHSLLVTRKQLSGAGESQSDVDARILDAIGDFIARRIRQPW